MTLENYISEAVSHGRKRLRIPMLDELDEQVTLDEFTGLLDALGFDNLSGRDDEFRKAKGSKVYKILATIDPNIIRVLVKNYNDNNMEYLRVVFDQQTKKFMYVQTVSYNPKIGTRNTDIKNLIVYLK